MFAVLVVWAAAACSSSAAVPGGLTPGAATFDGTLTFMPAHSWASAAIVEESGGGPSIVLTSLAGGADSCLAASAGSDAAGVVRIVVALESAEMPAPGRYDMSTGWQATLRRADSGCATMTQESATQGVLEIDSVGTTVNGTADVTFPSGRVTATFDAPSCGSSREGGSACTPYPRCPSGQGPQPPPATEACIASP